MTELGRAIDGLRDAAGFKSGNALAKAAGLHASVINNLIGGVTKSAHASTRAAIEDATGCPRGVLLQVQRGELTAAQALRIAADEPVDPTERESLAWRVTRLEAELGKIVQRLEAEERRDGPADG